MAAAEESGWQHFETTYLLPLQAKYHAKAFKVDFKNDAKNYLSSHKTPLIQLSPTLFDQFCNVLLTFCESLYEGRTDELSRFPYVERTGSKRLVTSPFVAWLMSVAIDEIVGNSTESTI